MEVDKPSGIILTNGEQWSNQRRFALKNLRDFGFGKQSLEGVMNYEIDELIDGYRSRSGDILISTDFNIPIISILWQIVAGSRITLEDSESVKMVDLVTELFSKGKIKKTFLRIAHFIQDIPEIVITNIFQITDFSPKNCM